MSRDHDSWRRLIGAEMESNGESWDDIVSTTLSDAELDVEFDRGYGGVNGAAFTAWTANHVYFPICHDGAEWCGSVPRNPNGVATAHQGGG